VVFLATGSLAAARFRVATFTATGTNATIMNRKNLLITAATLTLALSQGIQAQDRELGAAGDLLDGVAALVDSGIVLKSELNSRIQIVVNNFNDQQQSLPPDQRGGSLPPLSVLEGQVLDQLILEEIQVQRAQRIGIEISDNMLNDVLTDVAGAVGVPLEQLPAWLESQGLEYAQFREDQRRDLLIRQLERREVMERISINPRELEQCLALTTISETNESDYNISHILIGFTPNGDQAEIEAAQDLARDIVRQLDLGADFAQLAIAHSNSGTALEGGNLGWRKGSELPTIFADDVRELEVGEHSTAIRGGGGFHIVRLNDKRGTEPQLVDQINARHILLTPTEILDDDATRQRLQGIRNQILDGDDFATVASAVSQDTGSAVDGGDLGWTTLDSYVDEFAAVLASLEIGELSEVFQTPFGWHIAEVVGRRSYDMTEDLRETECTNQIGRGKAVEESDLWRQRLRNDAYIIKRI